MRWKFKQTEKSPEVPDTSGGRVTFFLAIDSTGRDVSVQETAFSVEKPIIGES